MPVIAAMGDTTVIPVKRNPVPIADLEGTAIWNRQESILPFFTPISKVAAHGNWRQPPEINKVALGKRYCIRQNQVRDPPSSLR